jgi:hypothetical protein
MKKALALLPVVLVLAACGGGGGSGGGGGDAAARQAEQEVPGEENTPAYRQGGASCTTSTLDQLARDYGVKAEPKAVARAVAKSIEPDDKKAQDLTYKGCLATLVG